MQKKNLNMFLEAALAPRRTSLVSLLSPHKLMINALTTVNVDSVGPEWRTQTRCDNT